MYKIAIVGASTLLGKELKEALSESPLAAANFALLDQDDALGQLDQVGDDGGAESGHGVPALARRVAGDPDRLVVRAGRRHGVVAAGDVVEDVAVPRAVREGVQVAVQEAEP